MLGSNKLKITCDRKMHLQGSSFQKESPDNMTKVRATIMTLDRSLNPRPETTRRSIKKYSL